MSLRIKVYSRGSRWFWKLEEDNQAGWVEYAHPIGYASPDLAADAGRVELAKRVIRHGWSELNESAKLLTSWVLDRLVWQPSAVTHSRPRPLYTLNGRTPL